MRHGLITAKEILKDIPVRVAEVGVMGGVHALQIWNTLSVTEMFLIDSWRLNYRPTSIDSMCKTARLFDCMSNVYMLRMDTFTAARNVAGEFDFVYLDDNHEGYHLYREIDVWLPKIRVGGILAGHDFDRNLKGRVKYGLDKFCSERDIEYSSVDCNEGEKVGDWVIRKSD